MKTTKRLTFLRMTQTNGAGSGGWLKSISEQIVLQQTIQPTAVWDHETFASIGVSLGGQSIFQFYWSNLCHKEKEHFSILSVLLKTRERHLYASR